MSKGGRPKEDLSGRQYGVLEVLGRAANSETSSRSKWRVKCSECGLITVRETRLVKRADEKCKCPRDVLESKRSLLLAVYENYPNPHVFSADLLSALLRIHSNGRHDLGQMQMRYILEDLVALGLALRQGRDQWLVFPLPPKLIDEALTSSKVQDYCSQESSKEEEGHDAEVIAKRLETMRGLQTTESIAEALGVKAEGLDAVLEQIGLVTRLADDVWEVGSK